MRDPTSVRVLAISAGLGALLAPSVVLAQAVAQQAVSLREFALSPNAVSARQGQTVRFTITNSGTIEHNFKVENPGLKIEKTLFDANLKPGETRTAEFTFAAPGAWEMYCPVGDHEDRGMKGTIQVAAVSGSAAAPSQLPRTGGVAAGLGAAIGLALGALGLGLRRARR